MGQTTLTFVLEMEYVIVESVTEPGTRAYTPVLGFPTEPTECYENPDVDCDGYTPVEPQQS